MRHGRRPAARARRRSVPQRNNRNGTAFASAAAPPSFGCRWSPLSNSGRIRSGSAGSRSAASKSITPSYAPLVRIQRLTTSRAARFAGVSKPNVSFANGVMVPPNTSIPRSCARAMTCW